VIPLVCRHTTQAPPTIFSRCASEAPNGARAARCCLRRRACATARAAAAGAAGARAGAARCRCSAACCAAAASASCRSPFAGVGVDADEPVKRVAVDVAEHEVGPLALEQFERGGLVVGDEHAVAVGDEVVGEEAGGRRVLSASRIVRAEAMRAPFTDFGRLGAARGWGIGSAPSGAQVATAASATCRGWVRRPRAGWPAAVRRLRLEQVVLRHPVGEATAEVVAVAKQDRARGGE
jgi:hypothetical protein